MRRRTRYHYSRQENRDDEDEGGSKRNYIISALAAVIIIWITNEFWPGTIPFDTWSFWDSRGTLTDWIRVGWPIFAAGLGLNIILSLVRTERNYAGFRHARPDGLKVWLVGTLISVWAGVAEEIAFRWLIFLSATATIHIPNFLFFGFLGFGLAEWFHLNVWGPIANWTTFGALAPHIFHTSGWAAGAGMLAANAFFRDGHKYQGLLGVVNSWFIGMFLFWVTFKYGLLAAIVIHFLYDFLIFTYAALLVSIRR